MPSSRGTRPREAIDRNLDAKGHTRAEGGDPDFRVAFHGVVEVHADSTEEITEQVNQVVTEVLKLFPPGQ